MTLKYGRRKHTKRIKEEGEGEHKMGMTTGEEKEMMARLNEVMGITPIEDE